MDKNASLESKHIYKCLYLPNDEYQGCSWRQMSILWLVFFLDIVVNVLPTEQRVLGDPYSLSITSSIVRPSLGSVLPMTICPMDVVTVSKYTRPFLSSFTTQLKQTLDMPGSDTAPRVTTLVGVSWSTSTSSRVLKQVVTPVKPCGSVGGLTNANALASGGDLGGDEALGDFGDGLKGIVLMGRRTLHFARSTAVGGGTSPAAITGWDRCKTVFHLA